MLIQSFTGPADYILIIHPPRGGFKSEPLPDELVREVWKKAGVLNGEPSAQMCCALQLLRERLNEAIDSGKTIRFFEVYVESFLRMRLYVVNSN